MLKEGLRRRAGDVSQGYYTFTMRVVQRKVDSIAPFVSWEVS